MLIRNARNLRNRMTKEERHLWYDFLKKLPVNVYRQKVIGEYIADFYISSSKTVIELDGSQHYEDANLKKDEERDLYMNSQGIKVLRYSNYDINYNFDRVCNDIQNKLGVYIG
ncbi:MAG: DUF559 domain-containing protein [Clostridia bacterium]|nr:DUF559 domain-containing protein [Clostridia bacterium]